jgi:two-component system, LytTR family, sensor kinase
MRWLVGSRWLVLAGVWSIPALINTWQLYALWTYKGHAPSLVEVSVAEFPHWQLWALATPMIVAMGRRWPLTRRGWWRALPLHLGANAVVASADAIALEICRRLSHQWAGEPVYEPPLLESFGVTLSLDAFRSMLLYWVVIGIDRGLAYRRRYREEALSRAQLEARLVEAQLEALRVQLQPHFLFNTLNAISVLMRKGDVPAAIGMLGGLSDLLRESLSGLRHEFVTLGQELDFIRRYLHIAATRFSDRLRVSIEVEPELADAKIPHFILQPLVENALRHGLAPRTGSGRLEIVARIATDTADPVNARRLRVEVHDDGAGLSPGRHEGVGLAHVRKRLAQHYPGRHLFTVAPREPHGAVSILELPLEHGVA